MNENINLKGHIVLKDTKTGQILIDKDNRITEQGRKIVISKLFSSTLLKDNSVTSLNTYQISGVWLGTGTGDSTGEDTDLTMNRFGKEISKFKFELEEEDAFILSGLSIEVTTQLKGNSITALEGNSTGISGTYLIGELGLVATDTKVENPGESILFSRVAFDPIPIDPASEFSLTYYLYF